MHVLPGSACARNRSLARLRRVLYSHLPTTCLLFFFLSMYGCFVIRAQQRSCTCPSPTHHQNLQACFSRVNLNLTSLLYTSNQRGSCKDAPYNSAAKRRSTYPRSRAAAEVPHPFTSPSAPSWPNLAIHSSLAFQCLSLATQKLL